MGTVFRTGTERSLAENKMVGCYIPRQDAERISLHSILNNKSRSKLLYKVIMKFITTLPELEPMLQEIALKCLKDWQTKQIQNLDVPGWRTSDQITNRWEDYKKELIHDLNARKITHKMIQDIISRLEELQTL